MQDEVAKHTKKIYKAMKTPGHGFWEKTKEVAIEIFIIVFAVTLSIGLHNWSDHRHEQKETEEFEKGLKDDLAKDIRLLKENRATIDGIKADYKYLSALNDTRAIDTASVQTLVSHINVELRTTHPNIGRYEGFKSSGKIGTIENDTLKQSILEYYQQTIPNLVDIEEVVNTFQTRVMEMDINKGDNTSLKDLVKSFKMRALLQLGAQNLDGQIEAYDSAMQQAGEIIRMIDRQ